MSRVATGASAQKKRIPVGQRDVLSVSGKEPGWSYRIVNDEADRIQKFLDAGYELVDRDAVRIGDRRVNSPAPEGSKAQVTVSRKGDKAFVMRIREEWYKEDQEAKAAHSRKQLEAIKQLPSTDGNYGKVTIEK